MTAEDEARQSIDSQLAECGWIMQNHRSMNITAGQGVAIRELPLKAGEADYLLYADGRCIGVVESKPEELTKRDKLHLNIFWLKDKSLEDSENLPEPDVLAQEIAEHRRPFVCYQHCSDPRPMDSLHRRGSLFLTCLTAVGSAFKIRSRTMLIGITIAVLLMALVAYVNRG